MEIRAIIVDDEPLARNIIIEYSKNIPSLKIIGECSDAICASQFLQTTNIDLIFLDINMPKISGIDFLKNLTNPPLVILTTAYSEYALDGYELNVIDYLKKPYSFERFFKSINKAIEQNNLLKSDKKTIKIVFSDILYVEGLGDYIKIFTSSQKYISNLSMKKILSVLPSNNFYRIHKSFIVAIDKIESIEGNIIKINNVRLPISEQISNYLLKIIWRNRFQTNICNLLNYFSFNFFPPSNLILLKTNLTNSTFLIHWCFISNLLNYRSKLNLFYLKYQ